MNSVFVLVFRQHEICQDGLTPTGMNAKNKSLLNYQNVMTHFFSGGPFIYAHQAVGSEHLNSVCTFFSRIYFQDLKKKKKILQLSVLKQIITFVFKLPTRHYVCIHSESENLIMTF